MFDSKSRFANAETYVVTDRRGRRVNVVIPAPSPEQSLAGYHQRKGDTEANQLALHLCHVLAGGRVQHHQTKTTQQQQPDQQWQIEMRYRLQALSAVWIAGGQTAR